jgi:hypothetical protein
MEVMGAVFGQCPLCPDKGGRPVRLYGGYCPFHFKNRGNDKTTRRIVKDALEKLEKQAKRKN